MLLAPVLASRWFCFSSTFFSSIVSLVHGCSCEISEASRHKGLGLLIGSNRRISQASSVEKWRELFTVAITWRRTEKVVFMFKKIEEKKEEQRKTHVYVKKIWGRLARGRLTKQSQASVLCFCKVVLMRLLSQPLLEGNNLLLWRWLLLLQDTASLSRIIAPIWMQSVLLAPDCWGIVWVRCQKDVYPSVLWF